MGNAIQKIAEKEALDGLDALIGKLEKADALLLKAAADGLAFSKNLGGVKTPSGLNTNVEQNAKLTAELERQAKVIDMLEKQIVSLSNTRKAAQQATVQETVNNRILLRNATEQAKLNSTLIGSYEKLSVTLSIAQRDALNIGATYGKTSPQFLKAIENVNKLDAEIKELDASVGRNQRNVGNYKSGFNGLGNAINQITRELPAFTFSAQTGFLALSNNIPILIDQIQSLTAVNKTLAAEGKPTVSVFKQIISSVFSLNTVLSLAILATTLFGDKISEFFSKLTEGNKQLNVTKEVIEGIAKAQNEGAKAAQDELVSLKANLEIAKDVNLSLKDRNIAVDNLIKQYPYYFEGLTREQILAGETAKAEKQLTDAILSRAKAQAATTQITANSANIIDLNEKLIKQESELNAAYIRQADAVKKVTGVQRQRGDADAFGVLSAKDKIEQIKNDIKQTRQLIKTYEDINARLLSYVIANEKTAIGLDYVAKKTKDVREEREKLNAVKLPDAEDYASILIFLEKYRKELQDLQKQNSVTLDQFNQYQKAIDMVTESIKGITEGYTALKKGSADAKKFFEDQQQAAENLRKKMEQLRKESQAYISSFTDDVIKSAGLENLAKLFDGTFEKLLLGAQTTGEKFAVVFNGITEVVQDSFNAINKASQENFDAEYKRLETQKNIAIQFAGESDAAKEQIEKQYEQRRRQIQERELKASKEIARFNAVINTAQAIVSALATTPFLAGLALAGVAAAAGAVQIAAINQQQIPQYWEGGVHQGGLMMVNDDPYGKKGGNYREVVKTPDGKIYKPQGKNVILNAPKGTEVFRDYASFEQSLNNVLFGAGINPSYAVMQHNNSMQSGLSSSDYFAGINAMTASIGSLANQPQDVAVFDRLGMAIYSKKEGATQKRMANRLRIRRG